MKKMIFSLIILLVFSCSLYAAVPEVSGNKEVGLILYPDEIDKFNFGLSDNPVDSNNPAPAEPMNEFYLSPDLSKLENNQLVGKGSCYIYWDIVSKEKIKIQFKLESMQGNQYKDFLNWGCYTILGTEAHFNGYNDVEKVSTPLFSDSGLSFTELNSYGSETLIYSDDNQAKLSIRKIGSVPIFFETVDAKNLAADLYQATFTIHVESIE